MSDLQVSFDTDKSSMDELRPALDAALHRQFPGGMLKRHWDGDILRLSGPGAEGSIEYRDGQLVGQAQLRPPASMMRPVIEQKVTAAIQEALGNAG